MQIGESAFRGCSSLAELTIPSHVAGLGLGDPIGSCDVFEGVTRLARLELIGAPLDAAVVASLERCLAPGAIVVSRDLAGRRFGSTPIVAC
jgi:hypothetical protein